MTYMHNISYNSSLSILLYMSKYMYIHFHKGTVGYMYMDPRLAV